VEAVLALVPVEEMEPLELPILVAVAVAELAEAPVLVV